MTNAHSPSGPSARVADLARRLEKLGVLKSWDPSGHGETTYDGVDWNPERTQRGQLHVNVYRNPKRALDAVRQAVGSGAVAVCWASAPDRLPADLEALLRSHGVALLRVSDERRAFSLSAALLHNFPGDQMRSVGITGTNAKTTTAVMLAACLQRAGLVNALSTSLIAAVGEELVPPGLSTPDAPQIQELLARAVVAGATHAVVEASSQGLSHQRLADVPFSVAVCTTIGPDHLDVHGSDEAYRQAKRSLFQGLRSDGFAIYNADEPDVIEVAAGAGAFDVPVGRAHDALARRVGEDLQFTDALADRCGQRPASVRLATPRIAGHDLNSAALAATAAYICGANSEAIEAGLASYLGLPRRLSVVATEPFVVIDDMFNAHSTATTVERRLRSLRPNASRFVCGVAVRGNRGVATNALQGELLGQALAKLNVDEVHLTRSIDVVGPADQASDAECDAIAEALGDWGLSVTLHAQLNTLVDATFASARAGDLIALIGHTGMEPAVGMLQERLRSSGRAGRRQAATFVDADAQIRQSIGRSPTPPSAAQGRTS